MIYPDYSRQIHAKHLAFFRFIVLVFILVFSRSVYADGECQQRLNNWVGPCLAQKGIKINDADCRGDLSVVSLGVENAPALRIEVRKDNERAFRQAGEYGLAPLGEFEDWSKQPIPWQNTLDQMVLCVSNAAPLASGAANNTTQITPTTGHLQPFSPSKVVPQPVLPWNLLAGFAGIVVMFFGSKIKRSIGPKEYRAMTVGAFFGLFLFILIGRLFWSQWGFFHMNGQGPYWVRFTLDNPSMPTNYGPGFHEMFSLVVSWFPSTPDQAVIATNAVLGAGAAVLFALTTRIIGASTVVSVLAGIAIGIDPIFSRIAQSESYYATCSSLLFFSVFLLAAANRHRIQSWQYFVGTICAGFFMAQAARIHPVSWVAIAAVPAVGLLGKEKTRALWLRTLGAGIITGFVILITTGPELIAVLSGQLGQQWATKQGVNLPQFDTRMFLMIIVLLYLAYRNTGAIVLILVAIMAPIKLLQITNPLRAHYIWYQQAYTQLVYPVVILAIVALLSVLFRYRHQQRFHITAAIGLLLFNTFSFRDITQFTPVDQLEARLWLELRKHVPQGALVVYLSKADNQIAFLPIYGGHETPAKGAEMLTNQSENVPLYRLNHTVYYYRSSLCSTPSGQHFCQQLEEINSLALVAQWDLPALSSLPYTHYEEQVVQTKLFRVLPPAHPSTHERNLRPVEKLRLT